MYRIIRTPKTQLERQKAPDEPELSLKKGFLVLPQKTPPCVRFSTWRNTNYELSTHTYICTYYMYRIIGIIHLSLNMADYRALRPPRRQSVPKTPAVRRPKKEAAMIVIDCGATTVTAVCMPSVLVWRHTKRSVLLARR